MFVETRAVREFPRHPMLPGMSPPGKSDRPSRARRRNPPGTKPPGRPPREPAPDADSHGARLRRARLAHGFATVRALAERVGIDQRKLAEMERDRTRIDSQDLERLAAALPLDAILRGVSSGRAVPRRLYIAAFESEKRPDELLPAEPDPVPLPGDMPRRLRELPGLFAATIVDASADQDYGPGTTLYLRPLEPDERVPLQAPVVVRFLMEPGGTATREVLYGRLNQLQTGETVLQLRTRNPLLRGAREIQGGSPVLHGMSERVLAMLRQPTIEYRPRPHDLAEIVGVVEWADGPPRPQSADAAGAPVSGNSGRPKPRAQRG